MRGGVGAVVVPVTRFATDREALLFHHCTLRGFHFDYAPAQDGGPLVGIRHTEEWIDTIHLEGIQTHCLAWRTRPDGNGPPECHVQGSAATVMAAALSWGTTRVLGGGETTNALSG